MPSQEHNRAISVRRLTDVTETHISAMAAVLVDCVEGGASVGFLEPLDPAKAQAFWRESARAVARGQRALLVAEDSDGIVGTVQLILDLPENQPHRANLTKMLVPRRARRQDIGRALIVAAETTARELGRTLVVPTPCPAVMPNGSTSPSDGGASVSFPAMRCGRTANPATARCTTASWTSNRRP